MTNPSIVVMFLDFSFFPLFFPISFFSFLVAFVFHWLTNSPKIFPFPQIFCLIFTIFLSLWGGFLLFFFFFFFFLQLILLIFLSNFHFFILFSPSSREPQKMKISLFLFISFFSFLNLFPSSSCFSFDLNPSTTRCLRQEVRKNDIVKGEFTISPSSGPVKTAVGIQVTDISGHKVYSRNKNDDSEKGAFLSTPSRDDIFNICFENIVLESSNLKPNPADACETR
eukprot:Sdes_comp20638_c0_seq1m15807